MTNPKFLLRAEVPLTSRAVAPQGSLEAKTHWAEIQGTPGDGFFLVYLDESGRYLADDWAQSLEDAKEIAEIGLRIRREAWITV
ncbi:MAG: hypothetical protein KDA21_11245 [Phycisphaerales bacterium]|nr:hypothetical protein [Phycisphaerales bacterium]